MNFLTKVKLFPKPYDVIFYCPQHFNRSENGENPYFEKLIKSCIENNLSYLLLEEPDRNTYSPRSKIATKFDLWFYIIIIFSQNRKRVILEGGRIGWVNPHKSVKSPSLLICFIPLLSSRPLKKYFKNYLTRKFI